MYAFMSGSETCVGVPPRRRGSRARPTGGGRRGCADAPTPPHKHYDTARRLRPAPAPGMPLAPRLQNLGVHTFPVDHEGGARAALHQPGREPGLRLQPRRGRAARSPKPRGSIPTLAMAYWGQALVLGPEHQRGDGRRRTSRRRCALVQKAVALKAHGHAARARLHRRARRALHRQGRGSRRRPTAPTPTRCARSSQRFPTISTRGRSTPSR